jgi:haloacetate dehalogenase
MAVRNLMFEGFRELDLDSGETRIHARMGGAGPPLLLLHGHPQTHAMWHKLAPELARHFTIVAADLRGYGDSGKPPTTADHEPYSKRAMGRDMVAVMRALGFERFAVAGHDRGGRVGYRMALDHPARVERLAVLDIVPTGEMYRRAEMSFALGYWHWFFLPQPYDFPERLIGADPDHFYLERQGALSISGLFAPEALAEYRRCWRDPATIHAMCEDYRAGAGIDFRLDEADRLARRRIQCPLLALWGARGKMGEWYDVLAVWRDWADEVQGHPIDCGHYIPEEAPAEAARALLQFFKA